MRIRSGNAWFGAAAVEDQNKHRVGMYSSCETASNVWGLLKGRAEVSLLLNLHVERFSRHVERLSMCTFKSGGNKCCLLGWCLCWRRY